MKKILLLTCLYLFFKTAFCQTTSLYYYDPKLINPAFAGVLDEQNYQVHYNGAMNSRYSGEIYDVFTAYSNKLASINSGIGAIVDYDHIGTQTNFSTKLLYNYQVSLGSKGLLSVGTDLQYLNVTVKQIVFRALNPDDSRIPEKVKPTNQIYSGFGLAYSYDRFNVGIGARNVLVWYNSSDDWSPHKEYSVFTSYQIRMGQLLKLTPSIYVHSDFKGSHEANINLLGEWKFLMLGFSTDANNYENYSRYSAGFTVIKKIQIITSLYDGLQNDFEGKFKHLDVMLRVKIANKPKTPTN